MTERNDGGPAFPNVNEMGYGDLGMSLRDYFAAKASDKDIEEILLNNAYYENGSFQYYRVTRQQARYIHADEMLKAREE